MNRYTERFSDAIKRFITDLKLNFDAGFQTLMKVDPKTGAIPDEFSTRGWLKQFEYEHAPFSAPTSSTLTVTFTRNMNHNEIELAETFDT